MIRLLLITLIILMSLFFCAKPVTKEFPGQISSFLLVEYQQDSHTGSTLIKWQTRTASVTFDTSVTVDSGALQVDSVTGGVDGYTVFTVKKIDTKNGSVTINKQNRTSSCAIAGKLIVDTGGIFYNQGYVDAVVTSTSTTLKEKQVVVRDMPLMVKEH